MHFHDPEIGYKVEAGLFKRGVLVAGTLTSAHTIRIEPPLVITYELIDQGYENSPPEKTGDLRTYGIGAQILLDLGVRKMRVLSAPKKMPALPGFGLEVVGYVEE